MGFLTPLSSLTKVTAANLETISDEIGGWFVRKTADQTITSSAALTNDTELFVPVIATGVYIMQSFIVYNGAATPQIKIGWSGPTGATMSWSHTALDASVTATFAGIIGRARYAIGTAVTLGVSGTGQDLVAMPTGLLITTGTAGNLQFRWAQATSNATGSTVRADSYLFLVRVA